MIPFKLCPNPTCNGKFTQVSYNQGWWEEVCYNVDCDLNFRQYFPLSFEDKELLYITFHTKRFNVYAYFPGTNSSLAGLTHFYHLDFKDKTVQSPIATLKTSILEFDFNNIDKLDSKFFTLSIFS
jgi:hypothetical protein